MLAASSTPPPIIASRGPWRESSIGPSNGETRPMTAPRTVNEKKNVARLQPSSSVMGKTNTLAPHKLTPDAKPAPTNATATITQP